MSSGLFWRIIAKRAGKDGKDKLVSLQWGWTAGMTKKQLANYDGPKGKGEIITTMEFAEELRDELTKLLKGKK